MSTAPVKPPEILDKVVDLVLSYKPKSKSKKPLNQDINDRESIASKGKKRKSRQKSKLPTP